MRRSSAALLVLLTGCAAHHPALQTGRAVGAGHADCIQGAAMTPPSEAGPLKVTYEGRCHWGLTDRTDIGARVSVPGSVGVELKTQLLGDLTTWYAVAPGIDAAFMHDGKNDIDASIGSVALFASVHPAPWFAIYAAPRLGYLQAFGGDHRSYGGGSGGLRFGRFAALLLEASYYTTLDGFGGDKVEFAAGFLF